MKKRTLGLILALLMVFSLLPVSAAADAPKSGACGENLTWTLDDKGVLTISGTGDMANYTFEAPPPWNSYADSIKSVVVGSGVTSIGSRAFTVCTVTESVSLPNTLTSIGASAFQGCGSIKNINLPNSLKSVGKYAFSACHKLESISLPAGLKSISDGMFSNCEALKSVDLPDDITSIGHWAFQGCYALESFTVPSSVTSIGNQAFMVCSGLKSVFIPVSVTSIGMGSFSMCEKLTDVYYGGTEAQWKAIPNLDITGLRDEGVALHYGALAYPFTDVKVNGTHKPYADAIKWASDNGVTTGYGDGIFKPDQSCTRAQVVTFLWRAAGKPVPKSTNNPFADVSAKQANGSDNPYYTAILWAVGEGITLGYDSTHFAPDKSVTRAQFVTFLWRYENKPEAKDGMSIKDIDAVTVADFRAAILWAAGEGITTGYADGSFRPDNTCTRAHVVTFIYRDIA